LTIRIKNVKLTLTKKIGDIMQQNQLYEQILSDIVNVAKKGGDIFKNAHAKNVNNKINHKDFVTEYDKAVQDYIFSSLASLYPSVTFVGEEGGDLDSYDVENTKAFIVDPIDGTANFVNELSHSCVCIAYVEYGTVMVSVVYNPYKDHLYTAIKGQGAYCNGVKMQVTDAPISSGFVGFGTAIYYDELIEETKRIIGDVFVKCNDLRRLGSAGIDIALTAQGAFVGFFETKLCPWDYASGILLVEEAGGIITDFSGNRLPLNKRSSVLDGNKIAYKELFDIINNKN
jgi:myo-inositol-1(or 4)-monophosphatase